MTSGYLFIYNQLKKYYGKEYANVMKNNCSLVCHGWIEKVKIREKEEKLILEQSTDSIDRVHGDLFLVDNFDNVVSELDRSQGKKFTRRQISVKTKGKVYMSWIYLPKNN